MMIADQLPYYPLETCLVSGEVLGSMGKPLDRLHKNRLMRLCCKGCVRKFEKDLLAFIVAERSSLLDDILKAKKKPELNKVAEDLTAAITTFKESWKPA